jgi:hypothetical protein
MTNHRERPADENGNRHWPVGRQMARQSGSLENPRKRTEMRAGSADEVPFEAELSPSWARLFPVPR